MNENFVLAVDQVQADVYSEDQVEPVLVSYHLDIDAGMLYLTFSETVRTGTFHSESISLQNSNSSDSVSYTILNGTTSDPNQPEVAVVLSDYDLNNIKRILDLATTANDTYLAIRSTAIDDMNGNNISEIFSSDALQAEIFTADETDPVLQSFDLDLNSDILWLTFDETVLVSSVNTSYITLVNSVDRENITSSFVISSSDVLEGREDDPIIPIELSRLDSNELKRLRDLATSENDTFLFLGSEAVTDANFNPVVNISQSPLQVTIYTEDETRPEVEMFVVDMNDQTLYIFFSETVDIDTFRIDGITLQDEVISVSPTVTLRPPSETLGLDSAVVPVLLNINLLTSLTNLYNTANDSYLSVTNYTVLDTNGNSLVALSDGEAFPADEYIFDTTNVTLLNFTVDLDNFTLTLLFDETVSSVTIDYTKFHAYSDMFGSINITLTNGSFDLPYTHYLTLGLIEADVCAIKTTEKLWTSVNDTWLYVEQGAVYDWTMRNPLNELVLQTPEEPIEDLPPNLVCYSVDLTLGTLTLNFDEPVRPLTIKWTYVYLQSSPLPSHNDSYRLRGGTPLSMNGKQVQFRFTTRDLNVIKSITELFTDASNSYLTLQRGAILDMALNPSAPVEGFPVCMFMNDTTAPSLVEYSIDMNEGELFLTFSETVDVSSFYLPAFTLQSDSNVSYSNLMSFHTFSTETVAVTSDSVNMLDNKIVILNISLDDLNEIKRKRIATSEETTWLTLDSSGLTDNNLQSVVPLLNGINALPVVNYTEDTTSPELQRYDVSLNEGCIILYFSETVNVATLNVKQMTLQNARHISDVTETHTLTSSSVYRAEALSIDPPGTDSVASSGLLSGNEMSGSGSGSGSFIGGSSVNDSATDDSILSSGSGSGSGIRPEVDMTRFLPLSSFNSPVVKLFFSHFDLNTVKALTNLATSEEDTFFSFTDTAVRDMVGNDVTGVNTSVSLPVNNYTIDETSPTLRSFNFDLDAGNLTLIFTETVNVSSLDVTQLTLINSICSGTNYTLRSEPQYPNTSAAFGEDWPEVTIMIGHEDLDAIRNLRELFSGRVDSLLYLTTSAVRDNANNRVNPVGSCDAPRVREFTHDTTRPRLDSFDLDLDDGRLILTFSETVQILDSLDVSQITFQSTLDFPNDTMMMYTLTNSGDLRSSSMDADSRVVTIMLGFTDLNAIKYRSSLATSENDTYVSITDSLVLDQAGNPVESTVIPVRIVTLDTTSPILVNFTLDMNSAILILTFNETVNASSLTVDQISIQADIFSSDDYHSSPRFLTPGTDETFTFSDNNYIIVVVLGPLDRNEIKKRQNLAVSEDSSYLTATMSIIADMSGNGLVPISDGKARQTANFIQDDTSPIITNFTMDMNLGNFILTFDETVLAGSLSRIYLSFQDAESNASDSFQLRGDGRHSLEDSTIITVYISAMDLNEVKRLMICRDSESCFLTYFDSTVLDMVENALEMRDEDSGQQVAEYIPDVNRPSLVRFDTDLSTEVIRLTFNETVDASTINFTAFTLQDFFRPLLVTCSLEELFRATTALEWSFS